MNYLDQITVGSITYDIQDSNAQRETIQGAGVPSSGIVGTIGLHYFDTTASAPPYEYICTAASNGNYTWLPAGYGEDGESGVYYGTTQPSDTNIHVWIDPSGDADGGALPSGGNTGDILIKTSSSNYDIAWGSDISRVAKTGDIMTGELEIKSSNVEGDVIPSSGQYGGSLSMQDKNGVRFGYMGPFNENGKQGINIGATRKVNNNDIYHGLRLGIDANGNKTVSFGDLNIWKTALGIKDVVFNTTNISQLHFRTKHVSVEHKTETTVTWDTAFPNACLYVLGVCDQSNFGATSTLTIYQNTATTTNFKCYQCNSANVAQSFTFLGIGY